MAKLKAAIIGCGQIAGGYDINCEKGWSLTHACSYKLLDDIELVAVSEPNDEVRKNFCEVWKVQLGYADVDKMLEEIDLDIVSICSPTEYHLKAFKSISKNQHIKGVFCEKPLSYDIEEAKQIVQMSKGKVISLNYFRRWNPTFKELRNDLGQNLYGEVRHVAVRYTKGLLTNGSHFIDLLRWLFGEPDRISTYFVYEGNMNDPGVDFKLDFAGNFSAIFTHIPDVPYVYIEIDILTEKGKLSIKQRGQSIEWSKSVVEPNYNTFNMLKVEESKETDWKNCPTRAIRELIHAVKQGHDVSCSVWDGIRAMEVCSQILAQ